MEVYRVNRAVAMANRFMTLQTGTSKDRNLLNSGDRTN